MKTTDPMEDFMELSHDHRVTFCLTGEERDALESTARRIDRPMSWIVRRGVRLVLELDRRPSTIGAGR